MPALPIASLQAPLTILTRAPPGAEAHPLTMWQHVLITALVVFLALTSVGLAFYYLVRSEHPTDLEAEAAIDAIDTNADADYSDEKAIYYDPAIHLSTSEYSPYPPFPGTRAWRKAGPDTHSEAIIVLPHDHDSPPPADFELDLGTLRLSCATEVEEVDKSLQPALDQASLYDVVASNPGVFTPTDGPFLSESPSETSDEDEDLGTVDISTARDIGLAIVNAFGLTHGADGRSCFVVGDESDAGTASSVSSSPSSSSSDRDDDDPRQPVSDKDDHANGPTTPIIPVPDVVDPSEKSSPSADDSSGGSSNSDDGDKSHPCAVEGDGEGDRQDSGRAADVDPFSTDGDSFIAPNDAPVNPATPSICKSFAHDDVASPDPDPGASSADVNPFGGDGDSFYADDPGPRNDADSLSNPFGEAGDSFFADDASVSSSGSDEDVSDAASISFSSVSTWDVDFYSENHNTFVDSPPSPSQSTCTANVYDSSLFPLAQAALHRLPPTKHRYVQVDKKLRSVFIRPLDEPPPPPPPKRIENVAQYRESCLLAPPTSPRDKKKRLLRPPPSPLRSVFTAPRPPSPPPPPPPRRPTGVVSRQLKIKPVPQPKSMPVLPKAQGVKAGPNRDFMRATAASLARSGSPSSSSSSESSKPPPPSRSSSASRLVSPNKQVSPPPTSSSRPLRPSSASCLPSPKTSPRKTLVSGSARPLSPPKTSRSRTPLAPKSTNVPATTRRLSSGSPSLADKNAKTKTTPAKATTATETKKVSHVRTRAITGNMSLSSNSATALPSGTGTGTGTSSEDSDSDGSIAQESTVDARRARRKGLLADQSTIDEVKATIGPQRNSADLAMERIAAAFNHKRCDEYSDDD